MSALDRIALADLLHRKAGVSPKKARQLLKGMMEYIIAGVADDGAVTIPNFGRFFVVEVTERIVSNPVSGEPHPVRGRRRVSFRASAAMEKRVAEGYEPIPGCPSYLVRRRDAQEL